MQFRRILGAVLLVSTLLPEVAVATTGDHAAPYDQEFVITAYYSPLPDQCCYVKGSYEADKVLNGNGTHGASGAPVYPGMLAAPPQYAFGTVIRLPGIGTLKVTDRGGAIQVTDAGVHRLDVWAGAGEEGLARALAFGVQRVRGTVYPKGTAQPKESVDFSAMAAPLSLLKHYVVGESTFLSASATLNQSSLSARMLQEHLKALGYFNRSVTDFFGTDTQKALQAFLSDYGLTEPNDRLTETTAAYLEAAQKRLDAKKPLAVFVERTSARNDVLAAQRTLRFLGYYRGRTNGTYDDKLFAAIVAFQKDHQLVGGVHSPGAGRIGPLTQKKLLTSWDRKIVAQQARTLLMLHRIDQIIAERKLDVGAFLALGDKGDQVRRLQSFLADRGFFPKERISGLFGDVTRQAVLAFQIAAGVVKTESDAGAGNVGPSTLSMLRSQLRTLLYQRVRGEGWGAL